MPHHLKKWFGWDSVFRVFVIIGALIAARKTRLYPILLTGFLAVLSLTLLQYWTNNYSLALLAPWRMSVWQYPLAVCILLLFAIQKIALIVEYFFSNSHLYSACTGIFFILALALAFNGFMKTPFLIQQAIPDELKNVEAFIKEKASPETMILIPIDFQDLRLDTERGFKYSRVVEKIYTVFWK